MARVKCKKCNYSWPRRSKMYIARCPRCGGFQMLKQLPDRRFRKRKRRVERAAKKIGATVPVSVPAV